MTLNEFIVFRRARPLKKLCEFEGGALPEDYKSDCYQDVDESDYACKEKYRIMVSSTFPNRLMSFSRLIPTKFE